MDLRVKRSGLVGTDGKPRSDDYDVMLGKCTIGRITRVQRGCGPRRWVWTLLVVPSCAEDRGEAETLDRAKAAVRLRIKAVGPLPSKLIGPQR